MALEYFDNSKREMGDGKASLVLELLSTPVLIDTDIKIKALKEHWNTMKEFLETLRDVPGGYILPNK